MTNKKIKLPYSKEHEEKCREQFWKDQNQYNYPNRGVLPIREEETSDYGAFREAIEGEVDKYYLLKKLTSRQKEIAELKEAGLNQQEIADKTGLSQQTISLEIGKIKKIYS